jgi:hypothetical protein
MPPQLQALSLHLRLALRDLIWWAANRHRQGERANIAIFGSRRSGSTLLMQAIAANPGVKSVDQPDSVFSASAYQARLLPILDSGQLHHLDPREQRLFEDYVARIEAGALHVNEPWQFWKRDFSRRSDRIVYKLTDSHGAATWMVDRFGWQPLVLFRHPLSQALSLSRLEGGPGGWQPRVMGFLRSETYRHEHLDDRQAARAHDIWAGGDRLDRHVLGWILENLPLLRSWRQRPSWSMVSYEAMVAEPEPVVVGLGAHFALPATARMRASLAESSRSTRGLSPLERAVAIRRGDRDGLLGSWRARVDDEARRRVGRHLEIFGIDLYHPDRMVSEPLYAFPKACPAPAAATVPQLV